MNCLLNDLCFTHNSKSVRCFKSNPVLVNNFYKTNQDNLRFNLSAQHQIGKLSIDNPSLLPYPYRIPLPYTSHSPSAARPLPLRHAVRACAQRATRPSACPATNEEDYGTDALIIGTTQMITVVCWGQERTSGRRNNEWEIQDSIQLMRRLRKSESDCSIEIL